MAQHHDRRATEKAARQKVRGGSAMDKRPENLKAKWTRRAANKKAGQHTPKHPR